MNTIQNYKTTNWDAVKEVKFDSLKECLSNTRISATFLIPWDLWLDFMGNNDLFDMLSPSKTHAQFCAVGCMGHINGTRVLTDSYLQPGERFLPKRTVITVLDDLSMIKSTFADA